MWGTRTWIWPRPATRGLQCIAVTWGFRSEAFLREHGAEQLAHSAGELWEILSRAATSGK